MASKKKLPTFSVGFVLSVWFDKEIKAETLELAYEKAKQLRYADIIKDLEQNGSNDFHFNVMQICKNGVLEQHGF